MPCFQKIKEKVPDKCPLCGEKIRDAHCGVCHGTGKKKKKVPIMVYT